MGKRASQQRETGTEKRETRSTFSAVAAQRPHVSARANTPAPSESELSGTKGESFPFILFSVWLLPPFTHFNGGNTAMHGDDYVGRLGDEPLLHFSNSCAI